MNTIQLEDKILGKMNKQKKSFGFLKNSKVYIEYFSKLIPILIGAIIPIINGASYLYYKGIYDFWHIPSTYIEADTRKVLYNFCVELAIVIIFIGLANVFCYEFYKKRKNKWLSGIIKIVLVCGILVSSALLLLVYLLRSYSFIEIAKYVHNYPGNLLANALPIAVLLGGFIFIIGQPERIYVADSIYEKRMDKGKGKIKESKEEGEKTKKDNSVYIIIGVVFFIVGILSAANSVYSNSQNTIKNATQIDVVSINNIEYAVVAQYKNQWILKKCNIEEGRPAMKSQP